MLEAAISDYLKMQERAADRASSRENSLLYMASRVDGAWIGPEHACSSFFRVLLLLGRRLGQPTILV